MSMDWSDFAAEEYEAELYKNLNGLFLNDDDRNDYAELISTIFSIHIYFENALKNKLIQILSNKLNIQSSKKLEKGIFKLQFDSLLKQLDSLELINQEIKSILTKFNKARNKLAHENGNVSEVSFFDKKILSQDGFELLKDKCEIVLDFLRTM